MASLRQPSVARCKGGRIQQLATRCSVSILTNDSHCTDPSVGYRHMRFLAGCTVVIDGLYNLYISNASTADRRENAIFRAISVDGVRFVLHKHEVSPRSPYETGGSLVMWRDPFVVQDVTSKKWFMFLSATIAHQAISSRRLTCWLGVDTINATEQRSFREDFCSYEEERGCVAVAETASIDSNFALLPPAANIRQGHRWHQLSDVSAFTEMERPQVCTRERLL